MDEKQERGRCEMRDERETRWTCASIRQRHHTRCREAKAVSAQSTDRKHWRRAIVAPHSTVAAVMVDVVLLVWVLLSQVPGAASELRQGGETCHMQSRGQVERG
jgi:hypothetical protein